MESEITRIEINVNGKSLDVDIQPGEMLVDVLRNQLKLTGNESRLQRSGMRCMYSIDRWRTNSIRAHIQPQKPSQTHYHH